MFKTETKETVSKPRAVITVRELLRVDPSSQNPWWRCEVEMKRLEKEKHGSNALHTNHE